MNTVPLLLFNIAMILFSLLLPVGTIVFLYLIYDKLRRIEQKLEQRDRER